MTLRTKLLSGFILSATFSLIVGLIGLFAVSGALNRMDEIASSDVTAVDAIGDAQEGLATARSFARTFVYFERTVEDFPRLRKSYFEAVQRLDEALATYQKTIDAPELQT